MLFIHNSTLLLAATGPKKRGPAGTPESSWNLSTEGITWGRNLHAKLLEFDRDGSKIEELDILTSFDDASMETAGFAIAGYCPPSQIVRLKSLASPLKPEHASAWSDMIAELGSDARLDAFFRKKPELVHIFTQNILSELEKALGPNISGKNVLIIGHPLALCTLMLGLLPENAEIHAAAETVSFQNGDMFRIDIGETTDSILIKGFNLVGTPVQDE